MGLRKKERNTVRRIMPDRRKKIHRLQVVPHNIKGELKEIMMPVPNSHESPRECLTPGEEKRKDHK